MLTTIKRRKLRLRSILILPFVLQIFAAVGFVGWLSFRNGREAVNEVATQLRSELSARIEQKVLTFLDAPHQINEINADAIAQGYLNLDSPVETSVRGRRYFWRQIKQFKLVSYIYYANELREFIGASRTFNGTRFQIGLSGEWNDYDLQEYLLDDSGNLKTLLYETPNYNPPQNIWYQTAVTAGGPAWTPIYAWQIQTNISTDAVLPVYDSDGKIKGVLGVSLTLSQISDFLESLKVGSSGQTFILEPTGELVATSTGEKPFYFSQGNETSDRALSESTDGTQFHRLSATKSTNFLTRASAKYLIDTYGDLDRIDTTKQLEFSLKGDRQFLQVTPLSDDRGIEWLIVVAVPEKDFMAQINANRQQTISL